MLCGKAEKRHEVINVPTEIRTEILKVTDKYLYWERRNLNKNMSTDFSKKKP